MNLLTLLVVTLLLTVVQTKDLTLTADQKGRDVVAAVVDRIRSQCLLPDDRFLLRRLAYVESRDGEAVDTYTVDYHGGIWKVDLDMFKLTQACLPPIHDTCSHIQSAFGIDWRQVTWYDLRKPLYSGLGATLYILAHGVFPLPTETDGQATFWSNTYRKSNTNPSIYTSATQEIKDTGCSEQLDLAFILDGSGSIQPDDFDKVRSFVKNILNDFDISTSGVQVALTEFSDVVGDVTYLNSTSDKASLMAAINNIRKSGQTTNTAAAIDVLTTSVYTAARGARADAKRVTVLLTDGASGDTALTKAAAVRAKEKGITMFTVGVGAVNEDELKSVASDPSCTHFYKLKSFGEIDHLVYEIRRRSCGAPKIISSSPGDETPNSVSTILKDDPIKTTFVVNSSSSDGAEKYIKAEVDCGILKVYTSYDTPNPGPAFYSDTSLASDGRVSITKVNTTREGRPLYVTVIGTKLQESCSDVLKCQDAKFTLSVVDAPPKSDVSVVCRTWQGDRPCTQEELVQKGFLIPSCPTAPRVYPLTNPCTAEAIASDLLVQPHPYDVTKFIVCDDQGEMYPTSCPNNGIFNPFSTTCNNNPIFSLAQNVPAPSTNLNSICNRMLIPAKMHFPFPGDETKFIQCNIFRIAYVRNCGPGTVYNDALQNCAEIASESMNVVSAAEACRDAPVGAMLAYAENFDYYIHCSPSGAAIMPCPVGTRWDDVNGFCNYGN